MTTRGIFVWSNSAFSFHLVIIFKAKIYKKLSCTFAILHRLSPKSSIQRHLVVLRITVLGVEMLVRAGADKNSGYSDLTYVRERRPEPLHICSNVTAVPQRARSSLRSSQGEILPGCSQGQGLYLKGKEQIHSAVPGA